MDKQYADKQTLLRALTQLHEHTVESSMFGGAVLIRELTARQRQNANDAALAQDPEQPDNPLFRAMLIQQSVVDPESGVPYADGRRGGDGLPLIDPRTRAPLLTIDEVLLLTEGRDQPINDLANTISALSRLGPDAMFSGDPAADRSERDAGTGGENAPNDVAADTSEGSGDADGGDASDGEPIQGT
jgi:hypothetical protein